MSCSAQSAYKTPGTKQVLINNPVGDRPICAVLSWPENEEEEEEAEILSQQLRQLKPKDTGCRDADEAPEDSTSHRVGTDSIWNTVHRRLTAEPMNYRRQRLSTIIVFLDHIFFRRRLMKLMLLLLLLLIMLTVSYTHLTLPTKRIV